MHLLAGLHDADGDDQAPHPDQYEQVSVPKSVHFFEPIESPPQSIPAIPFKHLKIDFSLVNVDFSEKTLLASKHVARGSNLLVW